MQGRVVLAALCAGFLVLGGVRSARPDDGSRARAPTKLDLRLRVADGTVLEYVYTERSEQTRDGDTAGAHRLFCESTWTLRSEVKRTNDDGSVVFEMRWTDIRGHLETCFGPSDFHVTDAEPGTSGGQPINTRGGQLAKQVGLPSTVTVSPLGEVLGVEGPALKLMEGQDNPVATMEMKVVFQRLFARLPEETVRTGNGWDAERVVSPEFVNIIDMTAFGTLTEKLKVKKVTADRAVVDVSAKGKERKRKGDDDEPFETPKGRKPTHPVGTLTRWNVSAEMEIDHRTGLLVSRSEDVEAGSRKRWYKAPPQEDSLVSKATVTCRIVEPASDE